MTSAPDAIVLEACLAAEAEEEAALLAAARADDKRTVMVAPSLNSQNAVLQCGACYRVC